MTRLIKAILNLGIVGILLLIGAASGLVHFLFHTPLGAALVWGFIAWAIYRARHQHPSRPTAALQRRPMPGYVREQVIARDGYWCGICGRGVAPDDVHIDHIYPVSRGGTDELTNLRVTHSRCNLAKGAQVA